MTNARARARAKERARATEKAPNSPLLPPSMEKRDIGQDSVLSEAKDPLSSFSARFDKCEMILALSDVSFYFRSEMQKMYVFDHSLGDFSDLEGLQKTCFRSLFLSNFYIKVTQ